MRYQEIEKELILQTYPFRSLTIVGGRGAYLFDSSGKKYLDLMSNYGVNIFGHSNKKIINALKKQMDRITNLHSSFANEIRARATRDLLEKAGKQYKKVLWTNTGAETVEAALKMAVFLTKKRKFIVFKGAYHGKTLGALSATHKKEYREPFEPLLWNFYHIEYGNIEKVRAVIDEGIAGILIEPIQGEAGVIIPPPDFLKNIAKICKEKNVLFILDEIQTGMGRTGRFLASEGIEADLLCLGKALGGGIPCGALLLNEKFEKLNVKGIHTSTFGGNPLAMAGVCVTLEMLTNEVLEYVKEMGNFFLEKLSEIRSEKIKEVRGIGLMVAIELNEKNTPYLKSLQERGVLAIPAGERVIRFLPPFIIKKREIEKAVLVLQSLLS